MRYDSCRQCTKRRIKCDKGTPTCGKCIKKGIECSGIGKTYHFAENKTPETIEAARRGPSLDEDDAYDDTSNAGVCPGFRPTSADSTGFVVDESDDVEDTVFSPSGAQQFIEEAVVHRPGQQSAQMSKFSLHYPVPLYKPEQVMLMDHCKLTLLIGRFEYISHERRTKINS